MGTEWKPLSEDADVFEGRDRKTGEAEVDRHAGRSRLRLELPAPRPGGSLREAPTRRRSSSHDFVAAWNKVMNLDRFDLGRQG